MATVTSEYINKNNLKVSSGSPSQLNYGSTKIYRAYYGNQLVWDVWRTTLTANNFNIDSKGGNVSDYTTVESHYLDAINNKNNLAYTFDPSYIGIRTEATSTTHDVVVTQTLTGKSITVKATQAGATYTDSWNNPVLTINPEQINVSSSDQDISFKIEAYRTGTRTYSYGKVEELYENLTASIYTDLGTLTKETITGTDYTVLHLDANPLDSARTATITVNMHEFGWTAKATVTQAVRVQQSIIYQTPTVDRVEITGVIPASGGYASLTVYWTQLYKIQYDNGTISSGYTKIEGISTANIKTGISQNGGYIKNGYVYADTLGTLLVQSDRAVYYIQSYTFTANGVEGSGSGYIEVIQSKNIVTNTSYGTYNLSIGADSTAAMANSGGTRTITVGCTQNKTDKYSSGSTKDYTTNATATVKTSHGYFGSSTSTTSTTVTGSGSLTLHVLENLGSARTVTVTATVSSTSKTVSFTQNAMSYVFTSTSATSISVNASATTLTLTGTSTINGYQQSIAKGNVSLSSGLTLSSVTTTNGTYTLVLRVPANSSTSSRTFTATITQPKSGATIKYTITQAGKPQDVTAIYWVAGSGTWRTIAGGVSATAKLEYSSSLTGNVTVTLIVDGSTRSNNSFALSSGTTSGTKKQLSVNISSKTTYAPDSVVQLKFSYGNQSGTITCSQ